MKRGQASLDFLVTYGWALLVVAVVLGALSQLNLFNVDNYMRDTCYTGNQMECIESALTTQDSLILNLRNNHNANIEIINITTNLHESIKNHEINQPIRRGHTRILNLQDVGTIIEGSKESVNLIIQFKRVGSNNIYEIRGSTRTGFTGSDEVTLSTLNSIQVLTSDNGWLPVCDGHAQTFCQQLGFTDGVETSPLQSGSCATWSESEWQSNNDQTYTITCTI